YSHLSDDAECLPLSPALFFFTATPPSAIYTLSLHDALPICDEQRPLYSVQRRTLPTVRHQRHSDLEQAHGRECGVGRPLAGAVTDRKSTRLNSSHLGISYAVFCLKKKKKKNTRKNNKKYHVN